jgi:glycogen(starch) synthase
VLGDIGSLREIWADTAIFVPPEDDEALCSAINRLIHDPGTRLALAARSRVRALDYTPSRMVEAYLDLYGRLQTCRPALIR